MPTTVDSLDIQISAESKKASVAIDNLVKKLDRVSASLSGVNTRGLATMASGVNKLSNAMVNFSKNTKTADFSRITRNLNKLGEINPNSIAVASKSLGKIAGAMKAFDSINVSDNAAKLAELSKGISTLGYKSAEKALDNIPKLASAMKSFMKTLSTAPKVSQNLIDMTNAMARFARTGASGGKAANSLANSFSGMSRKISYMPSVFKKVNLSMSKSVLGIKNLRQVLVSALGAFGGIYAVFEGLKKSIDISSDLTEVQNVVDVAFGKYKKSIEDFSKISIKDFGMSELTAKTMAGRFQAMGTAIGFSQKKMSGMSVELTKLAADMASFYNVEQEDVAESLQSIFTGQTKPLRAYGLDLTQVTIEEWAHKQGIDAKMKSMSQAEKTMLRYQYVMANTGAAQGDFARTANTWANQVRVLKQNFEVLGSTVGGVSINALKPFVQGLNVIMVQINDFAKIISNALGKIFGWTYEEGGGATNPAEEMSSGMDDVADSTDKATKAQKEYNRQLGKFDELNNYNKQKNNNTNGGDGTGNGITMPSSVGTSTGKWTQGKSILKEYESEIDSLYELGATIGDTLKKAMERIDWDGIYAKAGNFGTGLASFLNGLISPDLFNELGETVAGTLNTALHFLDSFGKTFEWKNFGKSLSEGLKGFFGTFDWKLATDTFNTLTNGILDSIIAGLENIGKDDWKKVGQTIADMISGIDVKGITFKVGKIANELANSFYLLVSNKDTWKNLGKKIADGINGFFKGLNDIDKKTKLTGWQALGKSISNTIIGLETTITTALNTVEWEKVGQSIADFITSIDWKGIVWNFAKMATSIIGAIAKAIKGVASKAPIESAIIGLFAVLKWTGIGKNLFSALSSTVTSKIALAISGGSTTTISSAITQLLIKSVPKLSAVVNPYTALAAGLVASIAYVINDENNFKFKIPAPDFGKAEKAFDNLKETIDGVKTRIKSTQDTMNSLDTSKMEAELKGVKLQELADEYYNLSQKANLSVYEQKRLKELYKELSTEMPGLKKHVDNQTKAYEGTKDELQKLINKTKTYYKLQAAQEDLVNIAKEQYKNEKALVDAENELRSARDKQRTQTQKYNKALKDLVKDGFFEYDKATKTYVRTTKIANDEDNKRIKQMQKYGVNAESMGKKIKNAEKNVNSLKSANQKLDEEYKNTKKYIDKNTESLNKNALSIKKIQDRAKEGVKINYSSKTDEKYDKQIKNFASLSDKLVKVTADAEETGNYKEVKKVYASWEKNAKKTLTAYLNGEMDEKSVNELKTVWESLTDNQKKQLTATLKGDEKDNFLKLTESWEKLNKNETKNATANFSAKGTLGDIDKEIEKLEKKKIKLQTKGDTSGMRNIDDKIAKLKKQKIKIEAEIKMSAKTKASWKKLLNSPNASKIYDSGALAAMRQSINTLATGGIFKNGKWQNIAKYASGGFPNMGQMFIAREKGPELVGNLGGHTAVINNDQIVSSVSDGVYRAVLSAMSNFSYNNRTSQGDIVVQIDGKEVFRAVRNEDGDFKRRTGRSAFSY